MHKEILTDEQVRLLPILKLFNQDFGLVGGTAIALHIGHRQSLDFDLFSPEDFDSSRIRERIGSRVKITNVLVDRRGEYTIVIGDIKMTFAQYQFPIDYAQDFDHVTAVPDLLTLAAMKAYALGRRAKWKDYVDLYFIVAQHAVVDIIGRARNIFQQEFNEKTFRTQLAYFPDIDYSEEVIFMPGSAVDGEVIKKELVRASLS